MSDQTIQVVVNGQPVVVAAGSVRDVILRAIIEANQIGRPVEQWELRTPEGDVIPHDTPTDWMLSAGKRLFLNLGLPPGMDWQARALAAEAKLACHIEASPRCASCGVNTATCFGAYEDPEAQPGFACDDCCGHGNEDGWCVPIAEIPAKWAQVAALSEKYEQELSAKLHALAEAILPKAKRKGEWDTPQLALLAEAHRQDSELMDEHDHDDLDVDAARRQRLKKRYEKSSNWAK